MTIPSDVRMVLAFLFVLLIIGLAQVGEKVVGPSKRTKVLWRLPFIPVLLGIVTGLFFVGLFSTMFAIAGIENDLPPYAVNYFLAFVTIMGLIMHWWPLAIIPLRLTRAQYIVRW